MLDINFIKENVDLMKDTVKKRNMKCDIDAVVKAYDEYIALQRKVEEINQNINQNIKDLKTATPQQKKELVLRGRNLKDEYKKVNEQLAPAKDKYNELALTVPSTMAPDTPIGDDDSGNVEVEKFLEPTKFDFAPKSHLELGLALDLIDMESATKVAGPKFYYLKNQLVQLELALEMWAINKLIGKGFTPLITPDLAKTSILVGSGFNPRGAESNIYKLEDMDLNLIATAEITIGGFNSDKQLKLEDLPLKYVGLSHCFRREAGAAGALDAGLYRVHQFSKVEMYQFTTVQDGERALQELLGIEKEIYQDLKIPYRIVRICSGDMGAPAYKKYDIEAWMPGRGKTGAYGEVTSVGNFTTFQSRRLKITYKDKDGKRQYINTLNGTAIALTRTMLAIMENYQQKDGSIKIPQVLQKYTGFDVIKNTKSK